MDSRWVSEWLEEWKGDNRMDDGWVDDALGE